MKSATKVKVHNSSSVLAKEALETIGQDPQLITYELNSDGAVSKITTAKDLNGKIDEDNFSKNMSLSDAVYKSASGKLVTSSSSVTVTDDTVIFDIPNGKTDTEDYSIRDKKILHQ
ncbi:MAG: hypothetical protein L6V93_07410 [Clostridiales bacterium]|nr:MAG: hypothetical protein L6V93_07410 [Clostridiales bacterium]